MARSNSAVLSLALLLAAAWQFMPAFVPSSVPRTVPQMSAAVAGVLAPVLASQPAMAASDENLPGWPFAIVFVVVFFAVFVVGNIIFPGKREVPN